jgi:hypothetical protein
MVNYIKDLENEQILGKITNAFGIALPAGSYGAFDLIFTQNSIFAEFVEEGPKIWSTFRSNRLSEDEANKEVTAFQDYVAKGKLLNKGSASAFLPRGAKSLVTLKYDYNAISKIVVQPFTPTLTFGIGFSKPILRCTMVDIRKGWLPSIRFVSKFLIDERQTQNVTEFLKGTPASGKVVLTH